MMYEATPEKPQKDTFLNFEREQQLKAQIAARRNVDRANFLNKFDENKAKNMLNRAFAPRLPSINPQQKNPLAISHSPASNQRSVSTDPRMQQQHQIPKELTNQLSKHQDMKEMRHFINKNVLKDAGIVSPLEIYKTKKAENLKHRRDKLMPVDQEANIKQLTYQQIREFYYAELLDTEFNPSESPLEKKKKEVKQLLIQIGKRKSEKERYRTLMSHPKTVAKEKLALQGKIHANDIAVENLKQKLRETLAEAQLNLREIEKEMLADPQDRANQEFVRLAGSEVKNIEGAADQTSNAQGSAAPLSKENTVPTRQNSLGSKQNNIPSIRTKTPTSQIPRAGQNGSENPTYYSNEEPSMYDDQQSYYTQNAPSIQKHLKEIQPSNTNQQSYQRTPSNRNQEPSNNTYANQSGQQTQQNISQPQTQQDGSQQQTQQNITQSGPLTNSYGYTATSKVNQQTLQDNTNASYSNQNARPAANQGQYSNQYQSNSYNQNSVNPTTQENYNEYETYTNNENYRSMPNNNTQSNYQTGDSQQYTYPQTTNSNPKGNQYLAPPKNNPSSKVQDNTQQKKITNEKVFVDTEDEDISYVTDNISNQTQGNNMYPNQSANYVEETKGSSQYTYGAQQQQQKQQNGYNKQQNEYNNAPYQHQQQPYYGGNQGQTQNSGQMNDSAMILEDMYTYEEDSMELQGQIHGQATQNRNIQGAVRQPAASGRVRRNEAGQPPKIDPKTKAPIEGSTPSMYEDFLESSVRPSEEEMSQRQLNQQSYYQNPQQQQGAQWYQKQPTQKPQASNQQGAQWYQQKPTHQMTHQQSPYNQEEEDEMYTGELTEQYGSQEYSQQQYSSNTNPNNQYDPRQQFPSQTEQITGDSYAQGSGMNYYPNQNLQQPQNQAGLSNPTNYQQGYSGNQTGFSNNLTVSPNQTEPISNPSQTQNQTGFTNKQSEAGDPNKLQPVIQDKKTVAMSLDSNIIPFVHSEGGDTPTASIGKIPQNNETQPDLTQVFDPELAKALKRINARVPRPTIVLKDTNTNTNLDNQELTEEQNGQPEENSQVVNNDSQLYSNKSDFLKADTRIFDSMQEGSHQFSNHQSKYLNPLLDPSEYKYGAHGFADSREFNQPTVYPPAVNEIKLSVAQGLLPGAKKRKPDPEDPDVIKHRELNNELHMQRKSNKEKARLARKFLNLTPIDVRALKNRLGVSTLFEYIDSLRRYQAEGTEDQFRKIIEESLCSKSRADHFIDILKYILDLEEKYYEEQKKLSIRVVEKKFIDVDGKPENHKETHDYNSQIIYMFLPFWYTKFNDKTDPRVVALLNQFEINQFIADKIVSTMKLSTIEDFVLYYRNNRGSKEFGVFTENEIFSFIDVGWKRSDIEEFSRTIILLAKEALMTPKFLFDFPKIPKTYEVLNLANIKGLSLGALSSIVTCLVTRENSLKRVLISNVDLQPDATLLFELLFSTPTLNIIEIDVSGNPIKDAGFENILKSFKTNKANYLKIMKAGGTSLSVQGGIRVLSFIRETKFTYSYINLKVLSLENNQIGNMGLETIASSLVKNRTLTYLDLSFNTIQDGGLTSLCYLLKGNSALKVLYLHGNKFSNESTCKLFAELSSAGHEAGLVVLKIGDLQAHVDNLLRLISDGLTRLRQLRYVEIVSTVTTPERYEKAVKAIENMDHLYYYVRIMPTNPTRHTKGLIDLLSMHTYEETLKEIEFRKANPTAPMEQDQQSIGIGGGSNDRLGIQNQNQGLGGVNSGIFMNRHMKPVTEDLLKHVQEIVTDYYKQHTVEVICYCLQELIPYNTELKEGDTFLHRLVEFGQVEAAKHALNLGIDPEIRTAISHKQFPHATLLHAAVVNGSIDLVKTLLGQGAKVDVKDVNENTPLHYAASTGHLEVAELLIGKGAPLNAKNKKSMEPLYAAILSDDVKVWDYFMKKTDPHSKHDTVKEIIDRRLTRGITPLMIAIENECINMFNYFLRLGANVNVLDEDGRSAVHWAAEKDRGEYVIKLLNFGPKLNVKDSKGETPIVHAIRNGRLDLAQKMFEKDARLDVVTNKGDTLMHIAARMNRADIVQWLVDHGLGSNTVNIFNQKPQDLTTDPRIKTMIPENGVTAMQFDPYDYNPYDYYSEKGSQMNQSATGNSQRPSGTIGGELPTQSQAQTQSQKVTTPLVSQPYQTGTYQSYRDPNQMNRTYQSQREPTQMNQTYQSQMNQSGYHPRADQSPLKARALTPSKNRSFYEGDDRSYYEGQDPNQNYRSNGLGNMQQSYYSYIGNQTGGRDKNTQLPAISRTGESRSQSNPPNLRSQGPSYQNSQPVPQTLESIISKNQQNGQKWHQKYDANQKTPQKQQANIQSQSIEQDEAFADYDDEDGTGDSNELTHSNENPNPISKAAPPKQSTFKPQNNAQNMQSRAPDKTNLKRPATPADEYDYDNQSVGGVSRVSDIGPQNGGRNQQYQSQRQPPQRQGYGY